uniref:Photosystem II reaction center protein Z n=1 Tax=Chlorodesmis fastigiata TaxID=189431 RepID=A0A2P0QHH8_CHLFS|nr:photosystem II protein Z [Chlorodesmis fastigiata]ARO74223.1 photosystem II protein Z [Chlorodesmis fastigiata]
MNLLFQFVVFSLLIFSFILAIGIPVVFSGPSTLSWKKNKKKIFIGISLWFLLVFLVGIINSVVV